MQSDLSMVISRATPPLRPGKLGLHNLEATERHVSAIRDGVGTTRGTWTYASDMRKEGSFTPCSQCLATRGIIPAPMPMHEVLAKELRDAAAVPFKLEEARENGTGVQHPCVASGGFHGRRRLQPHR